jgi:hypothetical protein
MSVEAPSNGMLPAAEGGAASAILACLCPYNPGGACMCPYNPGGGHLSAAYFGAAVVHLEHELPDKQHKLGLRVDRDPLIDSMEHGCFMCPDDNRIETEDLLA